MAKRQESESFHIGTEARERLQRLKDTTRLSKSEIVRQGIALVEAAHNQGMTCEALLKQIGGRG